MEENKILTKLSQIYVSIQLILAILSFIAGILFNLIINK